MRKGIAVRTILLLVIGILVAGILVYMVYRSFTGTTLSQEECRSRAISYCTLCYTSNWLSEIEAGAAACTADYFGTGWTDTSDCLSDPVRTFCEAFIGGYAEPPTTTTTSTVP